MDYWPRHWRHLHTGVFQEHPDSVHILIVYILVRKWPKSSGLINAPVYTIEVKKETLVQCKMTDGHTRDMFPWSTFTSSTNLYDTNSIGELHHERV